MGRVRSIDRMVRGRKNGLQFKKGKILKPSTNNKGYLYVELAGVKRFVHRLVLDEFIGPCPLGMECAHENAIKTDCRLSNLCWKTHLDNIGDRERHGNTIKGEDAFAAKLIASQISDIRADQRTQIDIGAEYGVHPSQIGRIKNRKSWSHVP